MTTLPPPFAIEQLRQRARERRRFAAEFLIAAEADDDEADSLERRWMEQREEARLARADRKAAEPFIGKVKEERSA